MFAGCVQKFAADVCLQDVYKRLLPLYVCRMCMEVCCPWMFAGCVRKFAAPVCLQDVYKRLLPLYVCRMCTNVCCPCMFAGCVQTFAAPVFPALHQRGRGIYQQAAKGPWQREWGASDTGAPDQDFGQAYLCCFQ